ncbi:hypothetical protein KY333_02835 [Candidatus Woesearchaeota archaeon]|nr:hypothetical protein [Candidatus Woesearchaeota archaeon]MBW2994472.1 hypothetical protein [Candidatus Woesearchaeota archaeon]
MKRLIVLSLILLVVLLGCAEQQKAEQHTVKKGDVVGETKSQIKFKIDVPDEAQEIKVEDMKPTPIAIDAESTSPDDEWCKEGANWNFESTDSEIDASAQWEIKGLVSDGEYAGLCHVLYTAQTPLGETTMDYYFAENKESGYFEMKLPNGQVVKQEWTG